jgi:pectinesterase
MLLNKYLVFWLLMLIALGSYAQKRSVTVAQDGSGEFTTIQAAVNAMPDYSDKAWVIVVKPGVYHEKLVVPVEKTNITLRGEHREQTRITYNDYSGKGDINTFTSYTMLVQGKGFRMENMTVENTAGPVGQAVALHVEADRCVFVNCTITGNQDTLLAATEGARQYYLNCYIEGTTDFIFGAAVALFENCILHSKKNSYITAASTPEHQQWGFVFLNCKLTASGSATKVHLGRPWRPFAKTVFLNTEMASHIVPAGWHNWNKPDAEKTAFYAEFASKGPGALPASRVAWSKQLTPQEAKLYTARRILAGSDRWKPKG